MCGIGPKEIRFLCENSWSGGYGYTPNEVGDMTLDQIYMLITDEKMLRSSSSKSRSRSMPSVEALNMDKDGFGKVRAVDGSVIRLKKGGKSKVAMIKEQIEKEKEGLGIGRRRRRKK